MAEDPTIGFHRFEGQTLQTMYSWMHEQGSGPGSAGTARAALVELGTLLSDVESQMRTALKGIGIEWEGAAAGAAGETIRQSANWVSDAGQVSMTSCRPAADQGEAFTSARAQIQQPQTAEYGFGDAMADGFNAAGDAALGPLNPFDIQTDVDQAAKQNAAHHAAAVQAMYNWNSAAQTNLAAMQPVAPPQPIAVDAAPAHGAQQPAVGYGGSAPFAPAGGAAHPGVPSAVAAQHAGPAAVYPPGPVGTAGPVGGSGPVPTGPAGTGVSPAPFLPAAPAPTPAQETGPGGLRAGGPVTGPGSAAAPGAGAGIGPGGSAASDRQRGRPGMSGAPPAGGAAEGAARPGPGARGTGRGPGSFLQPAAAGARGAGDEDDEHQNRYWQKDSEIFEDNRLVAPPVLGEDPPR